MSEEGNRSYDTRQILDYLGQKNLQPRKLYKSRYRTCDCVQHSRNLIAYQYNLELILSKHEAVRWVFFIGWIAGLISLVFAVPATGLNRVSYDDVVAVYGPPDEVETSKVSEREAAHRVEETYLSYGRLGLGISFFNEKLAIIRVTAKAEQ